MQAVDIESTSEDESVSIPVKTRKFGVKVAKSSVQYSNSRNGTTVKAKTGKSDNERASRHASLAANTPAAWGNPDPNDLPEFARSAWATTFLPTLYDCLGQSLDPFVIDGDMVKTIQELVDISYPNADYRVCVSGRIYSLVTVWLFCSLRR
jgi:hypothetical protein